MLGFRAEDPAGDTLPERPSESRVQLSTHTYQTQLDHGPLLSPLANPRASDQLSPPVHSAWSQPAAHLPGL